MLYKNLRVNTWYEVRWNWTERLKMTNRNETERDDIDWCLFSTCKLF